MRVAVVDIGTNATRLLVADVADGGIEEVEVQGWEDRAFAEQLLGKSRQ